MIYKAWGQPGSYLRVKHIKRSLKWMRHAS
jgi:hypothetical protein